MNLIETCGFVGAMVACGVVIIALLLFALLGFCLILGAADSITNPHATEDAHSEYQNVSAQIGAGTAGMNLAVRNVTGG